MRRTIAVTLFIPLLFLCNATTALENATTIEALSDNGEITVSLRNNSENNAFKQQINVAPSSRVTITVTDIPSDIWFIVLQIHTYQYNATLAYDKIMLDRVSNKSLFGSNIGLYFKTHNVQVPIQAFLKHDNIYKLNALLVVVPYGRNVPIPGGCNMEFNIETAPYQNLNMKNEIIIVDTQPASVYATNGTLFPCEKNSVHHTMYRLYLPGQDFSPETYFTAIASMLTTQDIMRNGYKIPPVLVTSLMRRFYSAYIGTGSVYVTIATYGNYSSAYVPTFTYACSPILYPESCQILTDTFARVIYAVVLLIGILSIGIGHKFTFINNLLPSAMIGGVFGYIFAVNISEYETAINILIGLTSSVIAILISIALRVFASRIYILSYSLLLGFLCACITYLYAPAEMTSILEIDWLFWPAFVIVILAIAVFLIIISYAAETITCAVFTANCVIIAIDYYGGTNLKYIIITFIRRVTLPEFHKAFIYPPIETADIRMIIFWIALIIGQFIKLCYVHLRMSHANNPERESLLRRESHRKRPWFTNIMSNRISIRFLHNTHRNSINRNSRNRIPNGNLNI